MFDVGLSELVIIAFVALIVLGPERLPKAARFAGLWVRRARAQWYSVKAELERELAQEEMKKQFGDPLAQMHALGQELKQELQPAMQGLDPALPAGLDLRGDAGRDAASEPPPARVSDDDEAPFAVRMDDADLPAQAELLLTPSPESPKP